VRSPFLSVIVVNYNGAAKIGACVKSLLVDEHPSREIWIVDNASVDESVSEARSAANGDGRVHFIDTGGNLGYAGAINRALPHCSGQIVAVFNMDIVVEPNCLAAAVDFLLSNPQVGAVSPLITLAGGDRVCAIGQNVHVTALGFNRGLGATRDSVGTTPVAVSGIHGAAFFMPTELLRRLGGLDTSGFLYHEDVDLSWLLLNCGFDLYCIPLAVVRHDYFLSMDPGKLYLLERNRLTCLLVFLSPITLLLISPLILLTEIILWVFAAIRGSRFLRAKLRSYKWVINNSRIRADRRMTIKPLKKRSDWQVLSRMTWTYHLDQAFSLATERGPTRHRL